MFIEDFIRKFFNCFWLKHQNAKYTSTRDYFAFKRRGFDLRLYVSKFAKHAKKKPTKTVVTAITKTTCLQEK